LLRSADFLYYLIHQILDRFPKSIQRNLLLVKSIRKLVCLLPFIRHIDHSTQYDLLAVLTVDCGDPVGPAIPDTAFYSDIKQSIVLLLFFIPPKSFSIAGSKDYSPYPSTGGRT